MARFNELNEQDQIQYVKDEFILILEDLAKDKTKLEKYMPIPIKPAGYKAEDAEKFAKECEDKKANRDKVLEIVGSLKKKEGCLCNSCLDLNIANSVLPDCLDDILTAAKKEAESKSY